MEVSEQLVINLRVCGQTYPLTIKREDEQIYRDAERLINGRYAFYSNNYQGKDMAEYLRMAILEIAIQYVQAKANGNIAPIMDTLNGLIGEMDSALK